LPPLSNNPKKGNSYTFKLCPYAGLNFKKKQAYYDIVVYPIEKKRFITMENKNEN